MAVFLVMLSYFVLRINAQGPCPVQCNSPNCRPYLDDPNNIPAWKYGQCIGYCQLKITAPFWTICGAISNWGDDWSPVNCTQCDGYPVPPCVDICRSCPAAGLNETYFKNGICTSICVPHSNVPEIPPMYEGLCLSLYHQGEPNTTDCSQCTILSTTKTYSIPNTTPQICIDSGITSFGGWGTNIQHCNVSVNQDHCDVFQMLNGDSIVNPIGTCAGFCNHFGLECLDGWSNAELACPNYEGWNTFGGLVGCNSIGDPPTYTDVFTPDHICSCGATPTIQPTTATNMPTNIPTNIPTNLPTNIPTNIPTDLPTNTPTRIPTNIPTNMPTNIPTTTLPTDIPSSVTTTNNPTRTPISPTDSPISPTRTPISPTFQSTNNPAIITSDNPTKTSIIPSHLSTDEPTTALITNTDKETVTTEENQQQIDGTTYAPTSILNTSKAKESNEDIGNSFWVLMGVIFGSLCLCIICFTILCRYKVQKARQRKQIHSDTSTDIKSIQSISMVDNPTNKPMITQIQEEFNDHIDGSTRQGNDIQDSGNSAILTPGGDIDVNIMNNINQNVIDNDDFIVEGDDELLDRMITAGVNDTPIDVNDEGDTPNGNDNNIDTPNDEHEKLNHMK